MVLVAQALAVRVGPFSTLAGNEGEYYIQKRMTLENDSKGLMLLNSFDNCIRLSSKGYDDQIFDEKTMRRICAGEV